MRAGKPLFFSALEVLVNKGCRFLITNQDKEEMGKMKKLLVLLTVMVAVFGFTAGAFSQTICEQCKCTLRNVPCPTAVGQGGVCADRV